jgi:plasmid replication initiation protein
MRVLIQKYKKNKRKANHVRFLENRIAFLHNEIVSASFNSEYSLNKNITVMHGNIENKAKLLKKYNRRLKILIY